MRVIHILDHSIPLKTAYAMRTVAMLEQQKALGWETFQLTGPYHHAGSVTEEDVAGWHFYRTPRPGGILEDVPGLGAMECMGEIAYRIERIAHRVRPHLLHAHASVLAAIPALRVGRRLGIPVVYEVRPPDERPRRRLADGGRLREGLARRLETWVLRRADAVVVVHESLLADILARGIAPAKVTVVDCCADTAPHASAVSGRAAAHGGGAGCSAPEAATGYRDAYANLMGAV